MVDFTKSSDSYAISRLMIFLFPYQQWYMESLSEKELDEFMELQLAPILMVIDSMTGIDFERFLKTCLENQGFNVEHTKTSGDYGADLILKNKSKKIVVQAKRYKNDISISAIQEVIAAKSYYDANEMWVITNQKFTQSAINLAEKNNVKLFNRDDLKKWIIKGGKINE